MSLSQELILGKAGEFRVVSELLLKGHSPALVCCDNGVDIVLENGKRIQVKTTRYAYQSIKNGKGYFLKKPSNYYAFSLGSGKKGENYKYSFDIVICCIIDQNLFYIIPKEEISNVKTICINLEDKISNDRSGKTNYEARYMKYKNNWDLLKTGVEKC